MIQYLIERANVRGSLKPNITAHNLYRTKGKSAYWYVSFLLLHQYKKKPQHNGCGFFYFEKSISVYKPYSLTTLNACSNPFCTTLTI